VAAIEEITGTYAVSTVLALHVY